MQGETGFCAVLGVGKELVEVVSEAGGAGGEVERVGGGV